MKIETFKVGEIRTNCYIVKDAGEALIIDPGFEIDKMLFCVKGLKVKAIVLTHGHYDHVTEAFKLKEIINAPVYIHEKDEAMLAFSVNTRPDRPLKDGDTLSVGSEEFLVINTPGHSHGSICLYNKKQNVLFSGDTLFQGTWGRTDLPGGSEIEMLESLKKLLALPPETIVYPGHGDATTIKDEKNLII